MGSCTTSRSISPFIRLIPNAHQNCSFMVDGFLLLCVDRNGIEIQPHHYIDDQRLPVSSYKQLVTSTNRLKVSFLASSLSSLILTTVSLLYPVSHTPSLFPHPYLTPPSPPLSSLLALHPYPLSLLSTPILSLHSSPYLHHSLSYMVYVSQVLTL